nr:DUF5682 family protein [Actinoplanes ovalisporus]
MRGHIAQTTGRVSVVVGAFHAPALLEGPVPQAFARSTTDVEAALPSAELPAHLQPPTAAQPPVAPAPAVPVAPAPVVPGATRPHGAGPDSGRTPASEAGEPGGIAPVPGAAPLGVAEPGGVAAVPGVTSRGEGEPGGVAPVPGVTPRGEGEPGGVAAVPGVTSRGEGEPGGVAPVPGAAPRGEGEPGGTAAVPEATPRGVAEPGVTPLGVAEPGGVAAVPGVTPRGAGEPVVSLVPYTFDLLDARSGYPAGIRDPRWQQAVFDCGAVPGLIRLAADRFAVEVARELRGLGQPAGPGEAAEVARLAGDLASLRGLPAPGRGELVEALQTVLAQGAPAGVGRGVARATEEVLVGRRRGRLPKGAPVTGLRPAVEKELERLKLAGPGEKWQRVRLDPLRSPTDRARELAIRRLNACGAQYGSAGTAGPVPGGEALTSTWRVEWTPASDAALAIAGLHGVTLAQAAEGVLGGRRRRELRAGGPTVEQALDGLEEAALCGLPGLASERLSDVRETVCHAAGIEQIVAALRLLGRLEATMPRATPGDADVSPRAGEVHATLPVSAGDRDVPLSAGVGGVHVTLPVSAGDRDVPLSAGVGGVHATLPVSAGDRDVPLSAEAGEVQATLPANVGDVDVTPPASAGDGDVTLSVGAGDVPATFPGSAGEPGPMPHVGAGATPPTLGAGRTTALVGVGAVRDDVHAAAVAAVGGLAGSTRVGDARALLDLVQAADEGGRRLRLGRAIKTLARDGSPLMRGAAAAVGVLLGHEEPRAFGVRLGSWADLPGAEATDRLRGALSVAGALLQSGGEALTPLLDVVDEMPDEEFVRRLPALRGGFDALSPADRDRLLETITDRHGAFSAELPTDAATVASWMAADRGGLNAVRELGLAPPERTGDGAVPERGIVPVERWRLLLGRESDQLPARQRRLATALDELYGAGRGEGAYTVGGGAGREAAYPEVRDWLSDVEALFGADVRDEVLARAAERGRLDAVLAADPDRVRPSIDLLHTVLSLAGGLPEARLAKLRPLVAKLTSELTAKLARRIRPALTGIGTPRLTTRPTGRLDLAATVRRNLHTVRPDAAGRPQILPERPVFRSPGRRSVDWQVILLVDVSGSMEQSTIWAALTASVLAGVPALRTHFVTFSTEVIDLTDRVTDPLSLLLGIRVGGGTHIAAALRYARQMSVVPARTMVITISDFEEGFPLGDLLGATRALVDDGTTLLGCASLDDRGQPRYSTGVAGQLVAAGMPVAALSPAELAGWIGDRVR